MARKVTWTDAALNDLDGIAAYIARDSAYYAAAFVRNIRSVACSLARFPRRGRIVPELEREAIRELIVGNYRLVYRLSEDSAIVVALIHGARDFPTTFARDLFKE